MYFLFTLMFSCVVHSTSEIYMDVICFVGYSEGGSCCEVVRDGKIKMIRNEGC